MLNGRRKDVRNKTEHAIDASGANAAVVAGGIGKPETAASIVYAAEEMFGRVDLLINNAGTGSMWPCKRSISMLLS